MKFCVAPMFLVELHRDVLEVLQVVGSKWFSKLTEKIMMIALLMTEMFNFVNFGKKRERKDTHEI